MLCGLCNLSIILILAASIPITFVAPLVYSRISVRCSILTLRQGEFPGVIHQPSKYAARIAQAFTATDPSVRITRDQWEEVDDLGTHPYYFTDGVGTISQELGDRIWKTLCDARRDHGKHAVKPSAVI